MKDRLMAGKPKNRLELRRQYEAAEPLDPMEDENDDVLDVEDDDDEERRPKKKKPAKATKATKTTKTPKAPKAAARMRVVWAVVTDGFRTVNTFEFNQKDAAIARAAELTAKGKGNHFVQRVKEPLADNAPGLGAALPRPVAAPAAKAAPAELAAPADDDDEIEPDGDDDDDESDMDDDDE